MVVSSDVNMKIGAANLFKVSVSAIILLEVLSLITSRLCESIWYHSLDRYHILMPKWLQLMLCLLLLLLDLTKTWTWSMGASTHLELWHSILKMTWYGTFWHRFQNLYFRYGGFNSSGWSSFTFLLDCWQNTCSNGCFSWRWITWSYNCCGPCIGGGCASYDR